MLLLNLKYKRARHCSIQTSSNTITLTGGHYSDYSDITLIPVVEYSGLGAGEEVTSRELPPLLDRRVEHACGWYSVGDSKVREVILKKHPSCIIVLTPFHPLCFDHP